MTRTEIEWKAALLFRIQSSILRCQGMIPNKTRYAALSEFEKTAYRAVAKTGEHAAIEMAWKARRSRQYAALKSPYKDKGLSAVSALGGGGSRRG